MPLKRSALFAHSAHRVQLDFTKKTRSYLNGHRYNLLGFLSGRIAKLRLEDSEHKVDDSFSLYRLTSSNVVPMEEGIPQKSSREAGKECNMTLGEAM